MKATAYELHRYLERAMTVKDLREALEDFDDDTPVVFSYNYGDHWRTTVAERVENADEGEVIWSAYHRSPKILEDSSERDEDPDGEGPESEERGTRDVVVLCAGGRL